MMLSKARTFCEDTDVHGVKFLADSSRPPWSRVLWFCLIAASLTFMIYLFSVRVETYLRHEVNTRVTVSRRQVYLPSLRLCVPQQMVLDPNQLTASDIINGRRVVDGHLAVNQTAVFQLVGGKRYLRQDVVSTFIDLVNKDFNTSLPVELNPWFNVTAMTYYGSPLHWKKLVQRLIDHGSSEPIADADSYNYSDVYRRAHYQYNIDSCKMSREVNGSVEESECKSGWSTVPSSHSMCLVRYQDDGDKVVNIRELWIGRDPDTQVIKDYSKDSYSLIIEPSIETVNMATARGTIPASQPFSVRFLRVSGKSEIRRLGEPHTDCIANKSYTMNSCIADCMSELWFETYGCVEHHLGIITSTTRPVCLAPNIADTNELFATQSTFESKCSLTCKKPCAEDSYTVSTIYDAIVPPMTRRRFVFFTAIQSDASTETTRVEDVESYPLGSLLAELGGTMGLFVGVSVLSIAHLMEFCTSLVSVLCRHCKNNKDERTDEQ